MLGPHPPPTIRHDARTPDWALAGVQEFVPGKLESSAFVSDLLDRWSLCIRLTEVQPASEGNESRTPHFEPFTPNHHQQPNPYLDHGVNGFFSNTSSFQQPVSFSLVTDLNADRKATISPICADRPL